MKLRKCLLCLLNKVLYPFCKGSHVGSSFKIVIHKIWHDYLNKEVSKLKNDIYYIYAPGFPWPFVAYSINHLEYMMRFLREFLNENDLKIVTKSDY